MGCPKCGHEDALIFREFIPECFYVCAGCLALIVRTPFGLKVAQDDATEKYPELLDYPEIKKVKKGSD